MPAWRPLPAGSLLWAGLLSAAAAAYALWLALFAVPNNVDVSWLIVVGQRLLDGERLTVDVLEVNPPFSVWLYLPHVVLERLTGTRAETWMAVAVAAAGLASAGASWRILRADPAWRTGRMAMVLPVLVFAVLCLFPGEIGQREHWALIAVLPWIALQCARQHSPAFAAPERWMIVLAGICAGLVVAIKPPHFALAIMLPSACLALARRSWKPLLVTENLIGAAIAVTYAGWIVLFDPSFLREVMPFVGELYLPLRKPFGALMAGWPLKALLLAVLAMVVAGGVRRLDWSAAIPLLSTLGFLIAYLAMGKGWPNHAWPMLATAIWGFAVQLARTDFSTARLSARAAAVIGCVVILQTVVAVHRFSLSDASVGTERLAAEISRSVERPSVVSLAARLQVAHPLSRQMDARFVSRYPSAWAVHNADRLAAEAEDAESRARLEALRDGLIAELAAEIVDKKPDIVLYSDETGTRWNSVMLGNADVVAALGDYGILLRDGHTTVYVRSDIASGRPSEMP